MITVDVAYKKNAEIFTLKLFLGRSGCFKNLCGLNKAAYITIFSQVVPLQLCAKYPGIHAGFDLKCMCCGEDYRFDIFVGDLVTSSTLLQICTPSKGEIFLASITFGRDLKGDEFFVVNM